MALLTRWQPLGSLRQEMTHFQHEMDRFLNRWGVMRPALVVPSSPAVNIWEDDDSVYAEAELPGLKLENLEITVTGDDQLMLKGNRPTLELKKAQWHRQERSFGKFERVLTLPVKVDPTKMEARLEHGILTIKMAKSATAKPRRIPVKAE